MADCYAARYQVVHKPELLEEAEKLALRANLQDAETPEALSAMGTVQRITGRNEPAENSFRRALQLEGGWVPARFGLALVLERNGRFEEAEGQLRHCCTLRSEWSAVYAILGRFYLRRGRLNDAVDYFRRALDRSPDDVRNHSDLGAALQYLGRTNEAIAVYRRAIEIRPYYAALCNLGTLYRDSGRPSEAAAAFRDALAENDQDYLVWKALGVTSQELGQLDRMREAMIRAITLAEEIVEANPRNGVVLAHLAEMYCALGDHLTARLRIERGLALNERWLEVEISAAAVYLDLSERELFLRHLRTALELGFTPDAIRREPAFRSALEWEEVRALLREFEERTKTEEE